MANVSIDIVWHSKKMFCIVQFARHCNEFHVFHIKRNDVVVIIVLEVKFVSRLALIEIYLKYCFFNQTETRATQLQFSNVCDQTWSSPNPPARMTVFEFTSVTHPPRENPLGKSGPSIHLLLSNENISLVCWTLFSSFSSRWVCV